MTANTISTLVTQVSNETGVKEDDVMKIIHSLGLDRALANASIAGYNTSDLKSLTLGVKVSAERFIAR